MNKRLDGLNYSCRQEYNAYRDEIFFMNHREASSLTRIALFYARLNVLSVAIAASII